MRALAQRDIRHLWLGQVFSAMGDEVYTIALVWFATDLMGDRAGYLSAVQAASICVFSLFGGLIADHRDHRHVLIAADLARGALVLLIPLWALVQPPGLFILIPVAIGVSSLFAFFDPALKAYLPHLARDEETLQTANGLMEVTSRLARVIGPSFVGLLSGFIPLIHNFTFDALTFFGSALAVWGLPNTRFDEPLGPRLSPRDVLLAGRRLVAGHRNVRYVVRSGALSAAAWLFVFPLGIALLVRDRLPDDVGSLGFAIAGYGVGNLVSNLTCANLHCRRPLVWLYLGRVLGGVGFILLAFSRDLPTIMGACAVAALGGPLTDLGYVSLLQRTFPGRGVARVYRYATAVSYSSLLVAFLVSPTLLALSSIGAVTCASGVVILGTGLIGLRWRCAD